MAKNPKLDIILDYLRGEFPDFSIVDYLNDSKGHSFQLVKDGQTHLVTVMDDFLEGKDAGEINTCLADYRVAAVMRDVGEFHVLITNSGCIFA
jgi:hypothetical protein